MASPVQSGKVPANWSVDQLDPVTIAKGAEAFVTSFQIETDAQMAQALAGSTPKVSQPMVASQTHTVNPTSNSAYAQKEDFSDKTVRTEYQNPDPNYANVQSSDESNSLSPKTKQ